jgi:hypothetical protein
MYLSGYKYRLVRDQILHKALWASWNLITYFLRGFKAKNLWKMDKIDERSAKASLTSKDTHTNMVATRERCSAVCYTKQVDSRI